jgi:hypothetical protein
MLHVLRRDSVGRSCCSAADDSVGRAELLLRRDNPVFRGSAENKALWEKHMRLRAKAIKIYQGKVGKVLAEYRAKALKLLAAHTIFAQVRGLADIIFDVSLFTRDLLKCMDAAQAAVIAQSIDELHDEIGTPDDPWKMPPKQVKEFIAQRENKLAGVGDTVFNQLKTSLTEGIDKGETTDQLAGRVKGVFNNLSNYEARRIAMTETSAAYGFARHEAMTAAGIEYKGWLSSHGPTVRPAHAQAEADYSAPEDAIPVDDPFDVGGEDLMYPGDPSGSPENVINCHCIQLARKAPTSGDES